MECSPVVKTYFKKPNSTHQFLQLPLSSSYSFVDAFLSTLMKYQLNLSLYILLVHTSNLLYSSLDVSRKIIDILAGILITRANLWILITVLYVYTLQDYFTSGEKNFYMIFIFFNRSHAILQNIPVLLFDNTGITKQIIFFQQHQYYRQMCSINLLHCLYVLCPVLSSHWPCVRESVPFPFGN